MACSLQRLSARLRRCMLGTHHSLSSRGLSSREVSHGREKSARAQPVTLSNTNNYNALLDSAKNKDNLDKYEQFTSVLKEFYTRDKSRRGHLAFIRTAVQRMDDFGLEKDLMTYNKILDIFPRGRFRSKRLLDAIWPVPHPQLELCLEILTKMEEQGVRPSAKTYDTVKAVFGRPSLPLDKCIRIMFLFDRFADIDPYEIRSELPEDPLEISRLALFRMAGEDCQLMEIQIPDPGLGETGGHIIGGNSETQLRYLEELRSRPLSSSTPLLHVDGPHRLWLKKVKQFYFTLRLLETGGEEDRGNSTQSEGVVLGMCMCQPYSPEKLQKWIGVLQDKYPHLSGATIIYDINEHNVVNND